MIRPSFLAVFLASCESFPSRRRHPGRVRPSRPGTRPSRPGTRLSRPGTRPSRPGTRPSRPGTRASRPDTRLSRPGTRPSRPGTGPSPPERSRSCTGEERPPTATRPRPPERRPPPRGTRAVRRVESPVRRGERSRFTENPFEKTEGFTLHGVDLSADPALRRAVAVLRCSSRSSDATRPRSLRLRTACASTTRGFLLPVRVLDAARLGQGVGAAGSR